MLDPHHPAVEVDRPALLADPVAGDFPHLAGPQPRILELIDQGLDHLAVLRRNRPNSAEVTALTRLRSLIRWAAQSAEIVVGGHPPDLLGVGLEEDLEELAAEPIDDPVLDASLGLDRDRSWP